MIHNIIKPKPALTGSENRRYKNITIFRGEVPRPNPDFLGSLNISMTANPWFLLLVVSSTAISNDNT